jgi:nitrogen fixation protein FixH
MNATPPTASAFIVRSNVNPALILCTDGEFHAQSQCGPGAWCAKVYKTSERAAKHNPGRVVEPYTGG